MESTTITLHGHDLHVRSAGEGPVILLVHGIAGTAAVWEQVLPVLARTHTVLAPDLPGHGASGKPPGDYSIGALASVLRDLLVALGHERATVVGHSLGGGIAMQFAYQFPERCERLVLVNSGGLGRDVSGMLRAAALPGARHVIGGLAIAATAVGRPVVRALDAVGLRARPEVAEIGRGFASLVDPDTRAAFVRTLRGVVASHGQRIDARDRLYLAAEMPTLIVWGERDAIIPAQHGRDAHDAMPGSRLVVFEQAGHFPSIEEPLRFADELTRFIDETSPAAVSPESWRELLLRGS